VRAGLGFTHSEVRNAGDIVEAVPGSPLDRRARLTQSAGRADLVAWRWRRMAQVESSYVDERSFSLRRDACSSEPEYWLVNAVHAIVFGKRSGSSELWGRNLGGSNLTACSRIVGGLASATHQTASLTRHPFLRSFAFSLESDRRPYPATGSSDEDPLNQPGLQVRSR